MAMKTKYSLTADPAVYLPIYGQPVEFDTMQRREWASELWGSHYGPCRSPCCEGRAADASGRCEEHTD